MKTTLLLTALALTASPILLAAEAVPPATPVSAEGTSVIAADWRAAFLGARQPDPEFGALEASPDGPGLRLITREQPPHVYSLQVILLNEIPLSEGDTLFIRFAARSLKAEAATGVTKLRVSFSLNREPWTSSYGGEIGLGSEWQRFDIPFTCKSNFAAREAKYSFMFGYAPQIVEIADVQLIRYEPSVAVESLPKTRRFADPVKPEVLQTEVARIASLRAQLEAVEDPAPARGRTLHVATTGTATGDGTAAKPLASIQAALDVVKPGETILVAAGEYQTGRGLSVRTSGRPDAWIKLKAAPGTRPKLISSGWSGIELRGGIGYVEIDGFELEWIADSAVKSEDGNTIHGSGVAMMYATHNIRVLNNVVHGFGTGGIVSLDCDYLTIEGNTIYNTAKTSPYGGSAISLCRAFDFDKGTGYRNVVRGNVMYDNELQVVTQVSSGGTGRTLTDGNGIIIDVFNRSRANPLKPHGEDRGGPLAPYHGRTLVENNLAFNNGGRGIHVFRSSNVDVINNTTYMNQSSRDIQAGELTAVESTDVVLMNNIAYGRKDKRGNTQDGSTRVIWYGNLFHNVADVLVHEGIIEDDPLFVAPALDAKPEGFRLQPGSPALGKGVTKVAPRQDLTGKPRPAGGPTDLGAFQH